MGTETVTEVEKTERTITYCDICGNADDTVTEATDDNGDNTIHYHPDCLDDISVDTPQRHSPDTTPTSSKDIQTPRRIPVVLTDLYRRATNTDALQRYALIACWPLTGLWVAGTRQSPLDNRDENPDAPIGEYILGLLMWVFAALFLVGPVVFALTFL